MSNVCRRCLLPMPLEHGVDLSTRISIVSVVIHTSSTSTWNCCFQHIPIFISHAQYLIVLPLDATSKTQIVWICLPCCRRSCSHSLSSQNIKTLYHAARLLRHPASSCTLLQVHTPCRKFMHPDASSCTLLQVHAPCCKFMHPAVSPCTLLQVHAPCCKFMI